MISTRLAVSAVGVLVPLLAGCTIGGGGPTTTASQPTNVPTSLSSVEASSAAQAGVDLTNLPAPVASATVAVTVDGDPNAKLTINLHQLRRTGKLVTATFSFQVASTVDQPRSLFNYLHDRSWWPYLVDTQNLKRHDVVVGGGARAKTDDLDRFAPGQTLYAYAMFAAPPQDVTAMDVQMIDGAPTATNVPIT
mgnify:CR=1 FL=1